MKKYKFKAKIEAGIGGGAAVMFPYNVEEEFGASGSVPVQATFNGVPYTGSLMKCGEACHLLGILKAIREQTGKDIGDTIDVVVWKDDAQRTVEIPADFAELLRVEDLDAPFSKLSYTHRKEYCRWIVEAKREETRSRRLRKAVEMLKAGIKTPG